MEHFSSNHALTFALPLGLNASPSSDAFRAEVQLAKVALLDKRWLFLPTESKQRRGRCFNVRGVRLLILYRSSLGLVGGSRDSSQSGLKGRGECSFLGKKWKSAYARRNLLCPPSPEILVPHAPPMAGQTCQLWLFFSQLLVLPFLCFINPISISICIFVLKIEVCLHFYKHAWILGKCIWILINYSVHLFFSTYLHIGLPSIHIFASKFSLLFIFVCYFFEYKHFCKNYYWSKDCITRLGEMQILKDWLDFSLHISLGNENLAGSY